MVVCLVLFKLAVASSLPRPPSYSSPTAAAPPPPSKSPLNQTKALVGLPSCKSPAAAEGVEEGSGEGGGGGAQASVEVEEGLGEGKGVEGAGAP